MNIFLQKGNQRGFSLIELLVAALISSLLLTGLVKLVNITQWSYNTQNEINTMTQSANFAIRRLSDILLEVGADLPKASFKVVNLKPGKNDSIQYFTNPGSGVQVLMTPVNNSKKVPVDSGGAFKKATHIYRKSDGRSFAIDSVAEMLAKAADTVFLASAVQIDAGDTIFAYKSDRLYLNGKNLYQGDDILAEHIENLSFTFKDLKGNHTDEWSQMHSVNIALRGCTGSEDSHFESEYGDGYRRVDFAVDVRFRNK